RQVEVELPGRRLGGEQVAALHFVEAEGAEERLVGEAAERREAGLVRQRHFDVAAQSEAVAPRPRGELVPGEVDVPPAELQQASGEGALPPLLHQQPGDWTRNAHEAGIVRCDTLPAACPGPFSPAAPAARWVASCDACGASRSAPRGSSRPASR